MQQLSPSSEWDGLDCGPVADCYASFGVVLPDVYPEAPPPEQPVETECGDIAAWPEGYEQNPD